MWFWLKHQIIDGQQVGWNRSSGGFVNNTLSSFSFNFVTVCLINFCFPL